MESMRLYRKNSGTDPRSEGTRSYMECGGMTPLCPPVRHSPAQAYEGGASASETHSSIPDPGHQSLPPPLEPSLIRPRRVIAPVFRAASRRGRSEGKAVSCHRTPKKGVPFKIFNLIF